MPLPAFTLTDSAQQTQRFPNAQPSLLCFVKADCPTCLVAMPLIAQLSTWLGAGANAALNVICIGQDRPGNAELAQRFGVPIADDSALAVSFAYDLDTVPTVILTDGAGAEMTRLIGFQRDNWRALLTTLAAQTGLSAPDIDWQRYPEWRVGCGSKHHEPDIYERLMAAQRGQTLASRRVSIPSSQDPFEFMFEHDLTDGLPVIPPTPERVAHMLSGTTRDPKQCIAEVAPNMGKATVEKIAINAVMAGCKPEYLPVVIAAVRAACSDEFNIHGVNSTTWGATPLLVVNGPIRHRIGMNSGQNALGQGNRANATIGRALKLALRNIGGAKPGGTEMSVLGSPAKFTLCFAEWEEFSPFTPLHVERGFAADEDVVTLMACTAPYQVADQKSRTARGIANSLAMVAETVWHPKLRLFTDVLLVICPEHAEVFRRDGWSKADLRQHIMAATTRPAAQLLSNEAVFLGCAEGLDPTQFADKADLPIPKFADPAHIRIVVAGGTAGKFSAILGGWVNGPKGSQMISQKIE